MPNAPSASKSLAVLLLALAVVACGEPASPGEPPVDDPDAGQPFADGGDPSDDGGSPSEDAGSGPADAGPPAPVIVDCPPLVHEGVDDDYTAIERLRGEALRRELLRRVEAHFELSYNGAKDYLFSRNGIDVVGGRVECIYTGQTFNRTELDTPSGTDGYNVEHSWPQSDFFGSGGSPKTDLHHLFASEKTANSHRASLYFGETDCAAGGCLWEEGGSSKGTSIEHGMRVFEVRPEYRGEVARAHFYMSVRHGWDIPDNEEKTLRRWNRCDPPEAAERARNDAIEEKQENRNPFVDRPEFVDYISDF